MRRTLSRIATIGAALLLPLAGPAASARANPDSKPARPHSPAAVASAGEQCRTGMYFFYKSEIRQYLKVHTGNGALVRADGPVAGFNEAFHLCDLGFGWAFKSATGGFLTVDRNNGNRLTASNSFIGGDELFDFVFLYSCQPYPPCLSVQAIKHQGTGKYVSVAAPDGIARANRDVIGGYEAFREEFAER